MLSILRRVTAVDQPRKLISSVLCAKFCQENTDDMDKFKRVVWIDCEMTGLDKDVDHLLEVACLITDGELKVVAEGPDIVIHQSKEILEAMGDWCKEHHGQSGLTSAVTASKISLADAESKLLKFVQQYTPKKACPLAGNSVHTDREFLVKYMPHFVEHLHYRIIDVSTIKELCRRWYPDDFREQPQKIMTHRALDDIKESLAELKYYRSKIFKQ